MDAESFVVSVVGPAVDKSNAGVVVVAVVGDTSDVVACGDVVRGNVRDISVATVAAVDDNAVTVGNASVVAAGEESGSVVRVNVGETSVSVVVVLPVELVSAPDVEVAVVDKLSNVT